MEIVQVFFSNKKGNVVQNESVVLSAIQLKQKKQIDINISHIEWGTFSEYALFWMNRLKCTLHRIDGFMCMEKKWYVPVCQIGLNYVLYHSGTGNMEKESRKQQAQFNQLDIYVYV